MGDSDPNISVATTGGQPPAPAPAPSPAQGEQPSAKPPLSDGDFANAYEAMAVGDYDTAARISGTDAGTLRANAQRVATAQDGDRLALSVNLGHDIDSGRAARVYEQASKTGLPFKNVDANLDAVEQATSAANFDPYKFRTQSPVVAQMALTSPTVAAMMRPDMDKLSTLEGIHQSFLNGRLQSLYAQQVGQAHGALTEGWRDTESEQKLKDVQDLISTTPTGTAHGINGMLDAISGFAGSSGGRIRALFGVAQPNDPTPNGALIRDDRVRGLSAAYTGQAWLDAENNRDEQGRQLDPTTRWNLAQSIGAINMLGDAASLAPGVGGAVGKGVGFASRWGANRILSQSALDAATSPGIRSRLLQYGAQTGLGLTDLGAFGAAQSGAATLATKLAEIHDQEVNSRDFGTTLGSASRETLNSAWHGALDQIETMGAPTVLGHAIGAGISEGVRAYQDRRALATAQAVRDAGQTIGNLQMPPSGMRDILGGLSSHYNVPTTFIPAESWRDYWQGQNQDPGAAATAVLGPHSIEYESALAEQRPMEFPTATYMHAIAPTEHNAFFSSVLTHDLNHPSERDAAVRMMLSDTGGGYPEAQPGGMTAQEAVATPEAEPAEEEPKAPAPTESGEPNPDIATLQQVRSELQAQARGAAMRGDLDAEQEARRKSFDADQEVRSIRHTNVQQAGENLAVAMTDRAHATGLGGEFRWNGQTETFDYLANSAKESKAASSKVTGAPMLTPEDSEAKVRKAADALEQARTERIEPPPMPEAPHPVRSPEPVGEVAQWDAQRAPAMHAADTEAAVLHDQPRTDPLQELHHGFIRDLESRVRSGELGVSPHDLPVVQRVVHALAEHLSETGAVPDKSQITHIVDRLTVGAGRDEALRVLHQALEMTARPHFTGDGIRVMTGDVPEGVRVAEHGRTVTISKGIPRYREIDGRLVDVHQAIADHALGHASEISPEEYAEKIQPLVLEGKDHGDLQPAVDAPAQAIPEKIFGHGPGPGTKAILKKAPILARSMVGKKAAEALGPIVEEGAAVRDALAPQTAGGLARYGSGLLRETLAQRARAADIIDHYLENARQGFLRFSVKDNREFINNLETGKPQRSPELQAISDDLRRIDDQDRLDVQNLGEGKLQQWIDNHFPHRYTESSIAALGNSPFEGKRAFLKQRKFPTLDDAVKAGLEPLSNNPVDFIRQQHREMQGYVFMVKMRQEMERNGLLPFVRIGAEGPETHRMIDDPAFTAYGKPTTTATEHVDATVYSHLSNLLAKWGIDHERLASAGRGRLGYAIVGGPKSKIFTQYGTTMAVMAHELGHQMDEKYGLNSMLFKGRGALGEARSLMNLHIPDGKTAADMGPKWRKWSRMPEERAASVIELYAHNRALLRDMAPTITKRLEGLIDKNPELEELRKAVPSLSTKKLETELPNPGLTVTGHYWVPKEMAPILNNYLSSGLRKSATYRALSKAGNLLTGLQLGLSGFHFAFTSVDSAASQLSLAVQHFFDGNLGKMAQAIGRTPFSPINAFMTGRKIRAEWNSPGSTDPQTAQLVDAMVAAGARVRQDDFMHPRAVQRFTDAFHAGNGAAVALHAPMAVLMLTHHALMDHWVPQLKLGVAAMMVQRELDRNPGMDRVQLRETMGRVQDSVDNRLGQMVYDNLHWNKVVKDSAQLSVRALGWNLGTWRELGGGVTDFAGTAKDLSNGKWNGLTHRQAYVLAMPVMVAAMGAAIQYMYTGTTPQESKDYFFPKIGGKDANGDDQRIGLPSYMKDVFEAMHDPYNTAVNKLSPMFGMAADMLNNKDYYGTEIRHKDDPLVQQALQVAEFIGKQAEPFSVSNAKRAGVGGFIGFPQAPWFIRSTPAEQKAQELAGARLPQGARTQEQSDKSANERDLVQRLRSDDPTVKSQAVGELQAGAANGTFPPSALERIDERARNPRLDYEVNHLDTDDAMKVWQVASPQERDRIRPIIEGKVRRSRSLEPSVRSQYMSDLQTEQ